MAKKVNTAGDYSDDDSYDDDSFILKLTQQLAESQDSKIIPLLIQLEKHLDTLVESAEITRAMSTIRNRKLIDLMLVEIKRDFSNIEPNSWIDGVALIRCIFHVLSQTTSKNRQDEVYLDKYFVEFINNSLFFCRQLQNYYQQSLTPNFVGILNSKECFKLLDQVLIILSRFCLRFIEEVNNLERILQSGWFLQLFVTNDEEMSILLADWLNSLVAQKPNIFNRMKKSTNDDNLSNTIMTVLEELIFHLSVSTNQNLGSSHINCLTTLLTSQPNLIQLIQSRYRGLKLLILRWSISHQKVSQSGISKDFLQNIARLIQMLDRGFDYSGLTDAKKWAIIKLQAWFRGCLSRKRMVKANKGMRDFQMKYRSRRSRERQNQLRQRLERERDYLVACNRRRLFREKLEKEAELMEALSAPLVFNYLEKTRQESATKIQSIWRGYKERSKIGDRKVLFKKTKAVIVIQRYFKSWLSRSELASATQKLNEEVQQHRYWDVPGLTAQRRDELVKEQNRWMAIHKHEFKTKTDEERLALYNRSQESLRRHLSSIKSARRAEISRNACITQMENDCKLLLSDSPNLTDLEKGESSLENLDAYSCRIRPLANRASHIHDWKMKMIDMSWWRQLMTLIDDNDKILGVEDDDDYLFNVGGDLDGFMMLRNQNK